MHKQIAAVVVALFTCVTSCSAAQSPAQFPVKPVRLVTPYPPGGGTDAVPRPVVASLSGAQHAEPLLLQGAEATPSSPEELNRIMREESARWMKVIKTQNLKF